MKANKIETKYFNFPICLLQGFIECDSNKVLDDIADYCITRYADKNKIPVETAAEYFGVRLTDEENGRILVSCITDKRYTGLDVDLFLDFRNNNKTDFENAVLCAFLAAKSMIGNKPYYKLTNQNMWFNRMMGADDKNECSWIDSEWLFTRYKFGQIKFELQTSYRVYIYAYHTRGQYISTKLSVEKLAEIAEAKKKKNVEKAISQRAKAAHDKAMNSDIHLPSPLDW